MKEGGLNLNLKLSVPPSDDSSFTQFLTRSGTFMDGDLLVNRDGVRIVPKPPLIRPTDDQLTLADIDTIIVIGKGSGGVVQLVQHKWTGQYFALKVIQMNIDEHICKQIAQELKINQSSQCRFSRKSKSPFQKYSIQPSVSRHARGSLAQKDDHGGEVKIADFGVSAIMAHTSGLANTLPERISGGTYGTKSGIWSLGLVLLECATGRFPYSPPEPGEGWTNLYELMEAIVDEPPPSAPANEFSEEFCSFISACVQKDPNDRKSALELLAHPFVSVYDDFNINLAS